MSTDVLSIFVSITLEAKQERNKQFFIQNQQHSIYKYTYSEETSQEYGTSKGDHKYVTKILPHKEEHSKWYPMQRYRLQTIFQTDHQLSSEKEDVLERNSITLTKRTTKTMQRKHKGYSSTRYINEKMIKNEKDTNMAHINKSETRPRNKNHEMDPIGLYINISHQVLYNDTHYSLYYNQLYGNYDINYLWSKQKYAKEFDDSFKFPPSSLNRLKLKPGRKTQTSIKNIPPTKVSLRPLPLHGSTTQMDSFFKNTIEKKDKKLNQFDDLNKTPPQYNDLSIFDFSLRQFLSNVMSLLDYENAEEGDTINKDNNIGRNAYKPLGLWDWWHEFRKKAKDKLKDFIEKDVVNNVKKITGVKEEINKFLNKTKGTVKDKIKEIVAQQLNKNDSEAKKSENASARNNNFDQWHPWIHRVEDDVKVNSFIKDILKNNLKLFTAIGNKAKNRRWKKKIEDLAEMYKDKFNDYIIETSQHNIRSKMGTERVILNSVDVSNSIVKRLVNFVTNEADEKGSLRNNSELISLFDRELKKETKTELNRACSKLNICRSSNGMSLFLAEMLTKLFSLNNDEFKLAFKHLVQSIQAVNYTDVLDARTDKGIKETMRRYKKMPLLFQITAMLAVKNILTSVNKPFIMYSDINVSQIDKTMAAFEIIKTLDKKVPNSVENNNTWNKIKSQDVTNPDTIVEFVVHVKKMLKQLDQETRSRILQQCKIIYP